MNVFLIQKPPVISIDSHHCDKELQRETMSHNNPVS